MNPRMAMHQRLADLHAELATLHRSIAADADDQYFDQNDSPLGSRLHCKLIRSGVVTGFKSGRRMLARRGDVAAYLEQHRVKPNEAPPPPGEESFEALLASYNTGRGV